MCLGLYLDTKTKTLMCAVTLIFLIYSERLIKSVLRIIFIHLKLVSEDAQTQTRSGRLGKRQENRNTCNTVKVDGEHLG